VLCAARCDVTAWKASEDWWQRRGLETLRWQANLPNEASISVHLGDAAALPSTGPCGPAAGEGTPSASRSSVTRLRARGRLCV
jgi:hypothetical protein